MSQALTIGSRPCTTQEVPNASLQTSHHGRFTTTRCRERLVRGRARLWRRPPPPPHQTVVVAPATSPGDGTPAGAVSWMRNHLGYTGLRELLREGREEAYGTSGIWPSAIAHWRGAPEHTSGTAPQAPSCTGTSAPTAMSASPTARAASTRPVSTAPSAAVAVQSGFVRYYAALLLLGVTAVGFYFLLQA